VGKNAKKQSVGVYFNNMALYFESRMNKKRTPSDSYFGDFAHWEGTLYIYRLSSEKFLMFS